MAILGSWTTLDCPVDESSTENNIKICQEAFEWLIGEYKGIARVRKVVNPHDFGPYPSFEVDVLDADLVDVEEEDGPEAAMLIEARDELINKLNKVETEYYKKFEKYL